MTIPKLSFRRVDMVEDHKPLECLDVSAPARTAMAPDVADMLEPACRNEGRKRTLDEALTRWASERSAPCSSSTRMLAAMEELQRTNARLLYAVKELLRRMPRPPSAKPARQRFRCKRVRAAARLLAYLRRSASSKTAFDPCAAREVRRLSERRLFRETAPYHALLAEAAKASHRLHRPMRAKGESAYWLLPTIALSYIVLRTTGESRPQEVLERAFGSKPGRDFIPLAESIRRLRRERRRVGPYKHLPVKLVCDLLGRFVYCYEDSRFDDCLSGILASQFDSAAKPWPDRVVRAVALLDDETAE